MPGITWRSWTNQPVKDTVKTIQPGKSNTPAVGVSKQRARSRPDMVARRQKMIQTGLNQRGLR